jgi:hypothetical protein
MSDSQQPTFAVNEHVRVKRGVTDFDYADMPLGGWAGIVIQVEEGGCTACLVHWNGETLAAITSFYRQRCQQDGIDYTEKWLDQDDLEIDRGRRLGIESYPGTHTPLLRADTPDDRIRAVFGLASDDPLPAVDQESLLAYYEHLSFYLTVPFLADLRPTQPLQNELRSVVVLGLGDKARVNQNDGILCTGIDQSGEYELPLAGLHIQPDGPNHDLISDYSHWFSYGR